MFLKLPEATRFQMPQAISEVDRICGSSSVAGCRFHITGDLALNAGLITFDRTTAPFGFAANSNVPPVA